MKAITEHDVTVYQGDVREQLAVLSDQSVNCIVTSPPYYGLRDYGVDGQIGLEPSPAEYVAEMVAVFREARRVLADDGVLWLNLGDSYSASGRGPMGATSAVADRGADLAGTGNRNASGLPPKNLLGIPWRAAFALQADGWTLRNEVIWSKPNAMPESVTDRLSSRHETVFLLTKRARYWFDLDPIREPLTDPSESRQTWDRPSAKERGMDGARIQKRPGRTWEQRKAEGEPSRYGLAGQQAVGKGGFVTDERGRNPGDVWAISTTPFPGAHFATMPPALAERCILAGCPESGTVLDPFAGSGTTLMVARKLARKSVGIELNPDYIAIIRDRIGQTPFDFGEATA